MSKLSSLIIGTQPVASWSHMLFTGGLFVAAMLKAAASAEYGSLPYTLSINGLWLGLIAIIFSLTASKSVVATRTPQKVISLKYGFSSITLRQKNIPLDATAWVRVMFDGYKELIIEAGTSGYETNEIIRIPYKSGAGIKTAEETAGKLAEFWGVSNKGYMHLS
jgi:hypothetical protein